MNSVEREEDAALKGILEFPLPETLPSLLLDGDGKLQFSVCRQLMEAVFAEVRGTKLLGTPGSCLPFFNQTGHLLVSPIRLLQGA